MGRSVRFFVRHLRLVTTIIAHPALGQDITLSCAAGSLRDQSGAGDETPVEVGDAVAVERPLRASVRAYRLVIR